MTEVVIIGAGISGAASAYELSKRKLKVTLLDRYVPAAMASGWTMAGVRQSGRHPAELPLAMAAVQRWGGLNEELDGETYYRRGGNIRVARNAAEIATIQHLVEEQTALGLDIELLDTREKLVQAVPAISETIIAASLCHSDGHADPTQSTEAFVEAAKRYGTVCRFGERALSIAVENGRAVGVHTDKGFIPAGHVVVAAGVFANELLAPLGLAIPIEVQMVTAVRSTPMEPLLAQVIGAANADIGGRQEASGRFRVTSAHEKWHGKMSDGERPVVWPEAGSIQGTIKRFGEIVPAFLKAQIEEIWAGLIDQSADGLPVLESPPEIGNLTTMHGFSGHGFCLGPVTGEIVRCLVLGEEVPYDLSPFSRSRFDGWNGHFEKVTMLG